MHVQVRNRVAVDLVIEFDRSGNGVYRLGYPLQLPHEQSPFVCAEIMQLDSVPLEYKAAIPSHRTVCATGQVGRVQLGNRFPMAGQGGRLDTPHHCIKLPIQGSSIYS